MYWRSPKNWILETYDWTFRLQVIIIFTYFFDQLLGLGLGYVDRYYTEVLKLFFGSGDSNTNVILFIYTVYNCFCFVVFFYFHVSRSELMTNYICLTFVPTVLIIKYTIGQLSRVLIV